MTSDGPATGGRGYLATAASRFSSWWSGERPPPALTADTASGAGLQGGNDDEVSSSDGDANSAPLEGDYTPTTSDRPSHLSSPLDKATVRPTELYIAVL